jgi:hypothetical protein
MKGSWMSISLPDALAQVDLQPGRIYDCQIGRFRVEVRVSETALPVSPAPFDASDVMLDPWTDLPAPKATAIVHAMPGEALLPDPPTLPMDST